MRVFYFGFPGNLGGAFTEMLATLPLWRRAGIEVAVVPTWGRFAADDKDGQAVRADLELLGCRVLTGFNVRTIGEIPGLAGSVAVSMCNANFLVAVSELRRLGCKIVWANCMTHCTAREIKTWQRYGPADAFLFQSEFQRGELERALAPLGYRPDRGHLIRGAFAFERFPFSPRAHCRGEDFTIGRLSRAEPSKWSPLHWSILSQTRSLCPEVRSLNMGWTPLTQGKCGLPPPWAEVFAPQAVPAAEFLGRCHALICDNGTDRENWPRVGLEAMAAGVPLVVDGRWGWREMLRPGETGFLCQSPGEFSESLALLARDETLRLRMAYNARAAVEELADEQVIGRQWRELFAGLSRGESRAAVQ